MRAMDILSRIKSGEKVMVTMSQRSRCGKKYSLSDGTEVGEDQFLTIKHFLRVSDQALFPDGEPLSYVWGG